MSSSRLTAASTGTSRRSFPCLSWPVSFIWLGQITGLFDLLVRGLEYPIRLLGLPDKAAVSFLFGFFRRDYGAAGFYDMKKMGLLSGDQLVVASVTLTLFVPCVAQFLMNVKERGTRIGVGLSLFVLLFSFGTGSLVHLALDKPGSKAVKCSFCGMEFKEEEAQKGCAGCSLTKGCRMIRCPRCGYEMPPEPGMDQTTEGMEEKAMNLSERAEEILETLWMSTVEEKKDSLSLGLAEREEAMSELLKNGCVDISNQKVRLKDKGKKEGEKIVRRHRLAERLLVDVLAMKKGLIHEVGCKFEHLLLTEVEENVCTLLGHPKLCPHGKPIPTGRCCVKSAKEVSRAVCLLKDLEVKDKGTIAYLATSDLGRLNRLMAMGALPGISVTMIQKFPSYVFQVGQSQFAIDQEMAEAIYVRLGRDKKRKIRALEIAK